MIATCTRCGSPSDRLVTVATVRACPDCAPHYPPADEDQQQSQPGAPDIESLGGPWPPCCCPKCGPERAAEQREIRRALDRATSHVR